MLTEIAESTSGLLVGDRNYYSLKTLLAPYSSKTRDPDPKRSAFLIRLRYRIDTVFSRLSRRYSIKRVWARDLWQLASRLMRKVLSHTVALLLNHRMGDQPLQLSKVLVRYTCTSG